MESSNPEASAAALANAGARVAEARTRLQKDRRFYSVMVLSGMAAVFAGFSRTYFLKAWTGTPALSPLVHVHGAVFTLWLVVLLLQVRLVVTNRIAVHRRLGVAAGVLSAAMVVLGYAITIDGARHGFMGVFSRGSVPFRDPLAYTVLGIGDIALFALFVGLGLWHRRRADTHKRLMMLAMISLLSAALTRLPIGPARIPVAFSTLGLFVLAGPIHDWRTRRRVHRVYVWGGLLIAAAAVARPPLGNSAVWHHVARWLVG